MESLQNKKVSFKITRFIPDEDEMITLKNNRQHFCFIKIKSKYELTLESWLSKFVTDEVYPEYSWDNCNNVTNCIMKTKMSLLPKYLIIQLMRFESVYTSTQTILTKNDQFVEFPTKDLDLSNIYKNDSSPTICIYDLWGVIHHSGSMEGGHYYATIKNDFNSNEWHMFNGKSITRFVWAERSTWFISTLFTWSNYCIYCFKIHNLCY